MTHFYESKINFCGTYSVCLRVESWKMSLKFKEKKFINFFQKPTLLLFWKVFFFTMILPWFCINCHIAHFNKLLEDLEQRQWSRRWAQLCQLHVSRFHSIYSFTKTFPSDIKSTSGWVSWSQVTVTCCCSIGFNVHLKAKQTG